MNLRPRFSLKRLLRHGRAEVRRSLQARTVALTVILTLAVAIVFSGVSMVSVRASLLTQITSQSRADYSNMVQQAQTSLDAADVSATVQIQQLVNDLASSLQSEGPSNLIGVYLWSRDTNSRAIIPVSTEPSYQSLISDDIRSSVASDLDDSVFYQPVEIPGDSGMSGSGTPAAVLGTVLDFGVAGNLEFFAILFVHVPAAVLDADSAQSGGHLCVAVHCGGRSNLAGDSWHRAPIERWQRPRETLASGNLDMRVTVNRKDELGVLQQSFNTMADALNQKVDELEEASVFQKRFVSDVSHGAPGDHHAYGFRPARNEKRRLRPLHQAYGRTVGPARSVDSKTCSPICWKSPATMPVMRHLTLNEADLCEPIETAVDQVAGITLSQTGADSHVSAQCAGFDSYRFASSDSHRQKSVGQCRRFR